MKNLLIALALVSFSAHAEQAQYSPSKKAYTFRLAKDIYKGDCFLRAGAEIAADENNFAGGRNEDVYFVDVKYSAPAFFQTGCWSKKVKLTAAEFADAYAAASPEFAREREHEKANKAAMASARAKRPINLNVGDLVWLESMWQDQLNPPEVERFWEDYVGHTRSADCRFRGGDVRIKSVPNPGADGFFEVVLTSDSKGQGGCLKGSIVRIPELKLKEWFRRRMENAMPVAKGGKCYRESHKKIADCEYLQDHLGYQLGKLYGGKNQDFVERGVCAELGDLYDLKGISKVEEKDLEEKYVGVEQIANNYHLSLEYVKYCEKKLDPAQEAQSCLQSMEVACPAKTRSYGEKSWEDKSEYDEYRDSFVMPSAPAETKEKSSSPTLEP